MKISNVIMTNNGLALLAAATSSSPLTITKIDVGQAVASPVAGQLIDGKANATSIALVKYSISTDLFTCRNLSGKHVAITGVIPAVSAGYWVLQFGVYSGTTLLGIASIPAVQRVVSEATDEEYTIMLPVSDINKVVLNRNSLMLSKNSSAVANIAIMNTEFTTAMPTGNVGDVYTNSGVGVTTSRLVAFISVTDTAAEVTAEMSRVSSLVPLPVGHFVINQNNYFIATLQANNQWSQFTGANATAFFLKLGIGQIFFDKKTAKCHYSTPNKLIRIFNAPQ